MGFAVKFLGCKVSQADAMLARRRLLEAGHEEVDERDAELVVVNTCCITSEAEAKSRQAARRALGGGAQRVIVTGCAANLRSAQFAEISEQVTALQGTAEDVADEVVRRVGPGCIDEQTTDPGGALERAPKFNRTRGFVKIQDGCEYSCAYCIIPKVRGAARSRSAERVLDEVRSRVALGQPEVVMTGISVGGYRDPDSDWDLARLMREAAQVDGVERVRLSSVEVTHLTDSLAQALAQEPKVCPHLHVPLQSGDDRVLKAMNRHYDSATYLRTIDGLRDAIPGLNITTDVIVGFPTEDECAFGSTLDLVRAAGITRVHTFSFSERPGTAAASVGDPVPAAEKKRRSRELRGLSEALSSVHRSAKLGTEVDVLIDKCADRQVGGYSADYTRVYMPPESGSAGEITTARLVELRADGIWAEASEVAQAV